MLLLLALQAAAPAATVDWGRALARDAQAFHDDVAANHPGPHNRDDPGFAARNDAALARALGRARAGIRYPGYWYAMRAYVAEFDDGHVQFAAERGAPPVVAWPGFLTGYDDTGRQVVRVRDGEPALPPLGAELMGCDGIAAASLAATVVGAYRGRWQLAAVRRQGGGSLFVDRGNPYVRRPVRCRFRTAAGKRTVTLAWRPVAPARIDTALTTIAAISRPPIAERTLADGTHWYQLSSFDGDPGSAAGKALPTIIAGMARDRAAIAVAPATVLDLRGNGGGSSDWSHQIATVLWGPGAVDRAEAALSSTVDWRASAANVAYMDDARAKMAGSSSAEAREWFARSTGGMRAALAAGQPYWHDDDPPPPAPPAGAPPVALKGPVYIVTDSGCGSACLDAVDLWRALGAVHVGQETSADTLYMDIREDALPSGQATVAVPMKVYRGRKRGSNVPIVPVHRYAGDIADTPALERWIGTLR